MAEKNLEAIRHTLAHLLASSVRDLYPGAKNAIGTSIENGFYQDFDLGSHKVSEEDFPKIEKKMRETLKTWTTSSHREVTSAEAKKEFEWNEYKCELVDEFTEGGKTITFYTLGDFVDLCKGGHSENPEKEVNPKALKLDRVAGAYWRGNEKNKMLTRIYGFAFSSKEELDQYLVQLEEAKKRDHKKLGKELNLFMFHKTAPGMPYWLPKGLKLFNTLVEFWRQEHEKHGYQEIASPLVNKAELWKTSGHWENYHEDMFIADMGENEVYGIKPMNCPNAMLVFQSMQVSYRDLPLRLSDVDKLHRYERSGTLNGLLRVRSFQQDDSHNFITEDMIASEYEHIFSVCEKFYSLFDMMYSFRLGTRPEKFLGEVATWDKAEMALKKILNQAGKEYSVEEGDGAFYGPKVDIVMKDSLGRDWQMGTIQLDFQLPQRFNLSYAAEDGTKKMPVVVHRVIYGSLERFIGILIEHVAGKFPTWLSPVQVAVLPITDAHGEYANKVATELRAKGIRVEVSNTADTLGKKIRNAKMQKVPYLLVVGGKEIAANAVSVESRDNGAVGSMLFSDFVNAILNEVKERDLKGSLKA